MTLLILTSPLLQPKGLIQGGSDDGDDTIRLALDTYSSTSVYGGGGNDSIVISGSTDNGTKFELVLVTTPSSSSQLERHHFWSTIKGGAGTDSILIHSMPANALQSGLIEGGAGNDTITVTSDPGRRFRRCNWNFPRVVLVLTPSPSVLSVVWWWLASALQLR